MMLTGAESKHPENAYPGNVDAGNSPHGLSRTRQRAAPALVQILPLEIRFPAARVSPDTENESWKLLRRTGGFARGGIEQPRSPFLVFSVPLCLCGELFCGELFCG